jgi:outer membrane immunogenic protein
MRSGSVFGGVMLALVTTISAHAADMGVPPAMPASPGYIPAAFYWTGFYVGGEAGGGWGNASWVDAVAPATASLSPNGFLVGGFLGVNYQIGQVVLGMEGTFDGNWFNSNTTDTAGNNLKTQVFWTATTVGRLGIAFDRLLIYGKGGAAFAYDRATETTPALQAIGSNDRFGWTVGGGVEYAFTEHFTARVEYDYLTFSTKSDPLIGPAGPIGSAIIGLKINEAKAGLAYKF